MKYALCLKLQILKKLACIKDTNEENTCKEEYLCNYATDFSNCEKYPVTNSNKYVCISNERNQGCKELEICSAENGITTSEECRKLPVYENRQKKEDYICVSKSEGGCKGIPNICPTTEKLEGDEKCSNFPASNPDKYACISNEESNVCKEIEICSAVKKKDTNFEECLKHPVYENGVKKEDYICVSNKKHMSYNRKT